jgi:hypothetical protein
MEEWWISKQRAKWEGVLNGNRLPSSTWIILSWVLYWSLFFGKQKPFMSVQLPMPSFWHFRESPSRKWDWLH